MINHQFISSFPHLHSSGCLASVSAMHCLHRLWFCFCVNVCVFVNAILTRGGCRKCLWQVMTTYKDARCVFGSCVCRAKKELFRPVECSFCLGVNALDGPRVCIYIYTCQRVLWGKDDVLPDAAEKTCRTESYCLTQWETGILWLSLWVSVRVLAENLRRWLSSAASAKNAVHVFFHAVVDFLYYRRRLSVVVVLLHQLAARYILFSH